VPTLLITPDNTAPGRNTQALWARIAPGGKTQGFNDYVNMALQADPEPCP